MNDAAELGTVADSVKDAIEADKTRSRHAVGAMTLDSARFRNTAISVLPAYRRTPGNAQGEPSQR